MHSDPHDWTDPRPSPAETVTALREAAQYLASSDRGRLALRRVVDWLDESGLALDSQNQEAILMLLQGAWGGWAGTVREAMHEALGDYGENQFEKGGAIRMDSPDVLDQLKDNHEIA